MKTVDILNWLAEYLEKNRLDSPTFGQIKDAYIEYCKGNNIELPNEISIDAQLQVCLDRLEKDGYLNVYDFLDDPTYHFRSSIGIFDNRAIYRQRTQEEIDIEREEKEYAIEQALIAKRDKRRERRKTIAKKLWRIVVKYWWALAVPLIGSLIGMLYYDKYLKPFFHIQ